MPLVNMTDMINHARRHNYAVGSFGVANLQFLEGILQAAENSRAPVILNLIESHFEHYDFELMMHAVTAAVRRASVPVAINFDHGTSLASAERAIRAGCNGVMVDTSALPFSDNLWQTRDIVKMAHACGVTVEGELGYVPGMEGESARNHPGELAYTSVAEAVGFVERTGVDCLAVSIGTVHGRMKGVSKLDYARLSKIREAVPVPLVIHGGSGLSDDQFRKLISHGISKVNYYTALSDAASRCIREKVAADKKGDHSTLVAEVRNAVREETERCMHLWGCGGRASEVLAQCKPWREVEHIVLYNVDENLDQASAKALVDRGEETLAAIPGVRSVKHGVSVQDEARYKNCWMIRFASENVVASYRDHPDHVRYANNTFRPAATDRLTIDYTLDG